jgi:hypothetical protein
MAKTTRGRGQDRKRVAEGQEHELDYMKEKHGISGQQLAAAIRAVGNSREKVEKYLKEKGRI